MSWQDWVFAVGGSFILVSLIPTIQAEEKPALTTSLTTTVLVAIFATTMLTLGLWLAAAINYGISGAWGVLAMQGFRLRNRRRDARAVMEQIEDEIRHSLPEVSAIND